LPALTQDHRTLLCGFGYHGAMPPNRYRGPPMSLANMRENGVRSLSVTCELCHHDTLMMDVDAFRRCDAGSYLRPAHGLHLLRIGGTYA